MGDIETRGYAHPEMLVSTEWVSRHIDDASVRIIESNEDQLLYKTRHIRSALEVDWVRDLNDPVRRDYLQSEHFSELASRLAIEPDTTLVFYGDKNNWWAAYALWVFHLFGHLRAKIMDGGSLKWEREGRPFTKDVPHFKPTHYPVRPRDDREWRVFREEVLRHSQSGNKLIDVRSPDEFSGKRLHMEGYPNEGALRGGHIPGAKNVPWGRAVDASNGTFKSAQELEAIYSDEAGLTKDDDVVVYCRIGERSSHTWFVLHYLLGYPRVKNYDGSWTEWGNLVGVPIER